MHGLDSPQFVLPALLVGGFLVVALAALALHLLFPATKKRKTGHMVLGRMARLCPVCQTKLARAERNGLEIEICPGCHGVWLSQGKLEQLSR